MDTESFIYLLILNTVQTSKIEYLCTNLDNYTQNLCSNLVNIKMFHGMQS